MLAHGNKADRLGMARKSVKIFQWQFLHSVNSWMNLVCFVVFGLCLDVQFFISSNNVMQAYTGLAYLGAFFTAQFALWSRWRQRQDRGNRPSGVETFNCHTLLHCPRLKALISALLLWGRLYRAPRFSKTLFCNWLPPERNLCDFVH